MRSSLTLNITVAKQNLYRFRIGLDADKERCQAVTQVTIWHSVIVRAIKVPKTLITTALREAEQLQTPYRVKGRR